MKIIFPHQHLLLEVKSNNFSTHNNFFINLYNGWVLLSFIQKKKNLKPIVLYYNLCSIWQMILHSNQIQHYFHIENKVHMNKNSGHEFEDVTLRFQLPKYLRRKWFCDGAVQFCKWFYIGKSNSTLFFHIKKIRLFTHK